MHPYWIQTFYSGRNLVLEASMPFATYNHELAGFCIFKLKSIQTSLELGTLLPLAAYTWAWNASSNLILQTNLKFAWFYNLKWKYFQIPHPPSFKTENYIWEYLRNITEKTNSQEINSNISTLPIQKQKKNTGAVLLKHEMISPKELKFKKSLVIAIIITFFKWKITIEIRKDYAITGYLFICISIWETGMAVSKCRKNMENMKTYINQTSENILIANINIFLSKRYHYN